MADLWSDASFRYGRCRGRCRYGSVSLTMAGSPVAIAAFSSSSSSNSTFPHDPASSNSSSRRNHTNYNTNTNTSFDVIISLQTTNSDSAQMRMRYNHHTKQQRAFLSMPPPTPPARSVMAVDITTDLLTTAVDMILPSMKLSQKDIPEIRSYESVRLVKYAFIVFNYHRSSF